MAYLLGVDTGGTYTDAAIIDDTSNTVLGSAKALTTRSDLSLGIGEAVDAALKDAHVEAQEVALLSLSTTLATNALVEGQGGRVALFSIGFSESDLERGGILKALDRDPLFYFSGGHDHAGNEVTAFDEDLVRRTALELADEVAAFAVVSSFSTRNPLHEKLARDTILAATGLPVTCSHELSAKLNGPKRGLTAVLNSKLVGRIAQLVSACETNLARLGISIPLMVVRGDGALISAEMVKEHPIETILSGPAASIVGARWLTDEVDALVSDIGGTTTDIALLKDGMPEIDPMGALIGGHRTMVETVAMRAHGLGGDSEVHIDESRRQGQLRLGPRRLVPLSLLAQDYPHIVKSALEKSLAAPTLSEHAGRFAIPMTDVSSGLLPQDRALLDRIPEPISLTELIKTRREIASLDRLVARGLVMISGITPSDACHVLDRLKSWNKTAAQNGLKLMARRRTSTGDQLAASAEELAQMIVDQVTLQTGNCLLESAFAEDPAFAGEDPIKLAKHSLTRTGISKHEGVINFSANIGVPIIGLGASAANYYPAVGKMVGAKMLLPEHADVANAIGAVVGQIRQSETGSVTSESEGKFTVHLESGPVYFADKVAALQKMESELVATATEKAKRAGAEHLEVSINSDIREAEIEGRKVFVEAEITAIATGRPSLAQSAI